MSTKPEKIAKPAPKQAAKREKKDKPKPKPQAPPVAGKTIFRQLVEPLSAGRFPTVDAPLSAVANLRKTLSVSSPAYYPAVDPGLLWQAGDLNVFLYGQPGLLAIIGPMQLPETVGMVSGMSLRFSTMGTFATTGFWTLRGASTNISPEVWPLAMVFGTSSSYLSAFECSQKPIGRSAGRSYVMMSAYEKLYISDASFVGTPPPDPVYSYNFLISVWSGPEAPPVVSTKTVPVDGSYLPLLGEALYEMTGNGVKYVSVEYVGFTGAASDISSGVRISLELSNSTSGYGWVQLYTPDLDVDVSLGHSCRLNAMSCKVVNTSAMIARQGTILAARLPQTEISDLSPAILSTATQRFQGDAAKGVYTYAEFSAASERFRSAVNAFGGVEFDLDEATMMHVINISCPSWTSTPNSYAVAFDTALEFKTSSQRYKLDVARTAHGDLIAARRHANSTPWFFPADSGTGRILALASTDKTNTWSQL